MRSTWGGELLPMDSFHCLEEDQPSRGAKYANLGAHPWPIGISPSEISSSSNASNAQIRETIPIPGEMALGVRWVLCSGPRAERRANLTARQGPLAPTWDAAIWTIQRRSLKGVTSWMRAIANRFTRVEIIRIPKSTYGYAQGRSGDNSWISS